MMNIGRFFGFSLVVKMVWAAIVLFGMVVFLVYQSRLAEETAAREKAQREAQQRAAGAAIVRSQMMQLPTQGFQQTPLWASPTP